MNQKKTPGLAFIFLLFFALKAGSQTASSNNATRFQAQVVDSSIQIGYGLALGDVDGDKKIDILLADKKQFAWYRNGDWKRFVMIDSLTEQDNVCIAAADLDGDGKVEVAVGAQWIPSETTDKNKSGSVHFLVRPQDPTKRWTALPLYHEPTIHRMRWTRFSDGKYYFIVLPLHGEKNVDGNGTSVNMLVYKYPELIKNPNPLYIISTGMHATHNFEKVSPSWEKNTGLFIAGKEGIAFLDEKLNSSAGSHPTLIKGTLGAGEVRSGFLNNKQEFIAAIEPMHGQNLAVYTKDGRQQIDSSFNDGHALVAADILGLGYDQLLAGWRKPNKEGKQGIKLYTLSGKDTWTAQWIDENGMACEDIQIADLNGDGRVDIIASGRSTHNLKIYWNLPASR